MRAITARQMQVLEFIKQFITDNGFPPTNVEIAKHFEFKSANASLDHITKLVKKGYILRRYGLSRGISLTGKELVK